MQTGYLNTPSRSSWHSACPSQLRSIPTWFVSLGSLALPFFGSGLVLVRVLREGPTCVMVARRAFGAFIPVRLMPEGRVTSAAEMGPYPGAAETRPTGAGVPFWILRAAATRQGALHAGYPMKAGSGFHGDTGAAIHSLPFGPAVTRQLHSWIYEELVTSALETGTKARRAEGWWVDVGSADATDRLEFLVYQPLRRALEGIPEEDNTQSTNQVAPANRPSEVVLIADDRVANAAQRHGPRRSHRRDGPAGQGRSQIARCAALRPI